MYEAPKIVMEQPIRKDIRFYLIVAIGVIGMMFFLYGVVAQYRYEKSISLDQLNSDTCKEGVFIKDTLNSYVHQKKIYGDEVDGISAEMLGLQSEYYYTVDIGNNQKIRFVVVGPEKNRIMNEIYSKNIPFEFEGKVVKATSALNVSWYENTDIGDISCIIEDYVIREGDMKSKIFFIVGGFGMMIIAAICMYVYCELCRKGVVY